MTVRTLHVPDYQAAVSRLGMLMAAVLLAALFVVMARSGPIALGAGNGSSTRSFTPSAFGTAATATTLGDRPLSGSELVTIAPGEPVVIGGRVEVPVGLVDHVAYWVRLDRADGAHFGFVAARDIVVTAGEPTAIALESAPIDAFLRPETDPSGLQAIGAPVVPAAFEAIAVNAVSATLPGQAAAAAAGAMLPAWLPATVTRWSSEIEAAASAHGVDPALVALVVLVESAGRPTATSAAGATGLMQVMPGTAIEVAQRTGATIGPAGLAEPRTNLDLGTAYLAQMLAEFGRADDPDWQTSVELASAAYNGGPGHVGQHLTTGAPLFAEPAAYRAWVGGMWRERGLASSPTYAAWLAAGGNRLVAAAAAEASVR